MRSRAFRLLAGMLAVLTLRVLPACAALNEKAPVIEAFSFTRTGTTAEQAKSYRITETARGRFAWIELYYSYQIVLPMTMEDITAFSALIDMLKLSDWNGFDETDPDALDGESFSLNAKFSDGSPIAAYGSNRFPAGYAEAAARIDTFFQKLMESYEISVE